MSVVMRALAWADAHDKPFRDGVYLKHCDFEAHGGRGEIEFTDDPNKARRFENAAVAMAYWNRVSLVRPLRPDGKPNKPLTALTVEIHPL